MKLKKKKIIYIVIFWVVILTPLIFFNYRENVVSEIDNRYLMNIPIGQNYEPTPGGKGGVSGKIDDFSVYVSDRVGFRDEFIDIYSKANKAVFNEMVHPTYAEGQDGYMFFKFSSRHEMSDYECAFADMVKEIQDYCENRNVPFIFVFDPEKASIYTDKVPEGVNYNDDWVDRFYEELDKRGVNYVDNRSLLKEKRIQGEQVFNVKYNAGHWNDLGAFYGVNNIAEGLKPEFPDIHVNSKNEYNIGKVLRTSLQVSKYPIKEYEPNFEPKVMTEDLSKKYRNELIMNESFPEFFYERNDSRVSGPDRVLVFQGSYMNGMGYKFLENMFHEYVGVHAYQNVIDFDYYFNVFQPDCVIFETAEYVFTDRYYNQEKMENMNLNPCIDEFEGYGSEVLDLDKISHKIVEGSELTTLSVENILEEVLYGYVQSCGKTFDVKLDESCHNGNVVFDRQYFDKEDYKIILVDRGGRKLIYK